MNHKSKFYFMAYYVASELGLKDTTEFYFNRYIRELYRELDIKY